MITGAHIVLFTDAVEATRAFLRGALQLPSVDAGGAWLIFALAPAEVAVHAADHHNHEHYLMCDDLATATSRLEALGASFGSVSEERWGRLTVMTMPGGAQLPLYQPSHPSPTRP